MGHHPAGLAVAARGERSAAAPSPRLWLPPGLGSVVGDLTNRRGHPPPRLATGPGLGVSLESLRDIAACAGQGVLVQ